jgi:hypothetical protein
MSIRGPGKLSELLSNRSNIDSPLLRNNSRDSLFESERTENNSVLSPLDSHQSPQPGPGSLSPMEKPQSTTSLDDNDSSRKSDGKKQQKNVILKQLLSQDDTSESDKNDEKSPGDSNMNEAEAKKPNALLKVSFILDLTSLIPPPKKMVCTVFVLTDLPKARNK